jgi:Zn2+/Cd2+-exporting ATPase
MADERVRYLVSGVCCASEEGVLRKKLDAVVGAGRYDFNLITGELRIEHPLPPERVVREVRAAGFDARPRREAEPEPRFAERFGGAVAAAVALALTIAGGILLEGSPLIGRILLLAAILVGGRQIFLKAFAATRLRALDMNVLMSVAVFGALAIDRWTEAAMVIVLFAVSLLLENLSTSRARRALQSLLSLSPHEASVLRGGQETLLPADQVIPGDLLVVRPGEQVPLDGVVTEGASTLNEAPITGESAPVSKSPGDAVFSGSINGNGVLTVRVTTEFENTTLQRIIHQVEEAQSRRAPVQMFIDRFARIYTPSVLGIAVLVAAVPPLVFGAPFGEWLYRALVLLVIACPCALVISTPVTLVSALTNAARHGILVKGGRYLETLAAAETIAFDKTGTLTEGRVRVTAVTPLGSSTADEALRIACAIEQHSEHHLAAAILEEARRRNIASPLGRATSFEAMPGLGVRATVEGGPYTLGNRRLAEQVGALSPDLAANFDHFSGLGFTTMVLLSESAPMCLFALEDRARPHGRIALASLQKIGIRHMVMLSGDQPSVAAHLARTVGLDRVNAGLLPEDKVTIVERLKARRGGVVMVGDGINDSPALAAASVGVAMGVAGTDAALETADVVLMSDDLLKLPHLFALSRQAIRIIRQNIAIALGLKAVFFLLALTGHATLWMALLADDGASLAVILNGLRILGFALPPDHRHHDHGKEHPGG